MRHSAKEAVSLFLEADGGPRQVFDEEYRKHLLVVLQTTIKADHVFEMPRNANMRRARRREEARLCSWIVGNVESFEAVKLLFEDFLQVRVSHPNALPPTIRRLGKTHAELLREMLRRDIASRRRMRLLLQLLQLEMVWFGQMW